LHSRIIIGTLSILLDFPALFLNDAHQHIAVVVRHTVRPHRELAVLIQSDLFPVALDADIRVREFAM
jgi:hypothetical protein